jgi:hypothetical protein
MKRVICISVLLFTVSSAALAEGMKITKPLTREELTPFCSNTMIWQQFDVDTEKCLSVAVPCSISIAKMHLEFEEANQKLYSCVFGKLGINLSPGS